MTEFNTLTMNIPVRYVRVEQDTYYDIISNVEQYCTAAIVIQAPAKLNLLLLIAVVLFWWMYSIIYYQMKQDSAGPIYTVIVHNNKWATFIQNANGKTNSS